MIEDATAVRADSEAVYRAYLEYERLVRGGRVAPSWIAGGPAFWYAEGGPQERMIWRVDGAAGTQEPLFDIPALRAALTAALGHEPAGHGVPFDTLELETADVAVFELEGDTWALDLTTYALERRITPRARGMYVWLESEADRAEPRRFGKESFTTLGEMWVPESPSLDGQWRAAMADGDVVLRAAIDGQTVKLTDDGTRDVFWDVETVRWRPWSPDSQRLVVQRVDTTGMARIPTIHWLKPLEQAHEVITLPAGGVINRNEVFIATVPDGRRVEVDLGDTTDRYPVVYGWLPDGSELLVAVYDRLFSQVELFAADPATGSTRLVLREVSETFLTNHHFALWGTDTGFRLLPDGSGFLWRSERDGWAHLYRYDLDGSLRGQLTSGAFPVLGVTAVDQAGGWVYFQAHGDQDRPYDNHLYRVPLDGGAIEQLTEGKGRHAIALAPGCECFVDVFSSVDTPLQSVLRASDGRLLRVLAEADVSRLEEVGWTPSREYVVKAADGETDLWVTLHFPFDFDPARRYPLVEHIYGGPQALQRAMDFGVEASPYGPDTSVRVNFARALAQLGCIVLTMDGRGTPGRSKAFHDAVYRGWGTFEIDDHAAAIRQLAEHESFIDLDRVGVMGASWGGHYGFRALTQGADLYRAGIVEVPGFESRSLTLYEPYLGLPADNPDLYETADCFALVDRLRGSLLMTGGLNDTCTQKDYYRMSELLVRRGVQHDTMTFPNAGHAYPATSMRYDNELKARWLREQLGF
jgi:dipeptidyl aminopeptidase/acylaminoacyl peptidase